MQRLWLLWETAELNSQNYKFGSQSVFVYFVWISEQTAITSPHNIKLMDYITEIQPSVAQWSLYVPPV